MSRAFYNDVTAQVQLARFAGAIFHQLGVDAHRFGFPYLGMNQRLIGPTEVAQLIKKFLG